MAGGAGAVFASGWPAGAASGPGREQPANRTTNTANNGSARRLPELEQGMDLDPRDTTAEDSPS
jgi:hypothetical protein